MLINYCGSPIASAASEAFVTAPGPTRGPELAVHRTVLPAQRASGRLQVQDIAISSAPAVPVLILLTGFGPARAPNVLLKMHIIVRHL